MAEQPEKRESVKPEENLPLSEILKVEVTDERVERLKTLTNVDAEGVSEEMFTWMVRQQAQQVNMQYARFLSGIKFSEAEVDDLLVNAVDTHTHGGSDPMERLLLEDDIGIDYSRAGMRAMVVKCWYSPSASRNAIVQKHVNRYAEKHGLRPTLCFGGVVLNYSVGGFNPEAVRKCLGFPGMKYVWMPMVDSYHHRRVVYDDWSGFGLSFLDEQRKVKPEVQEILRIIADNDLVLASGHYPYQDTAVLIEEARRLGVSRIEVIHPAHIHSKHTIAQMKEQAARGAKLMLSGLGAMAFPLHETGPMYSAQIVKEVGPENLVYGSDFGQLQNFPHIIANRWMIKLLLAYGCTREEIRTVFQETPAKLLGLPWPAPTTPKVEPSYFGHPQLSPPVRSTWSQGSQPEGPVSDLSEQCYLAAPNARPQKDDACLC